MLRQTDRFVRDMKNLMSPSSNIVLCGFMSCGKTSIGKALAKKLNYSFTDTDQLLTGTFHMTIPEMYETGGESYFRSCERSIVRKAAALSRTVIATGGGMMSDDENARVLAERGIIIFIDQDFDTCFDRIMSQPERPSVKSRSREELRARYDSRLPAYKKYAAFTLVNPKDNEAAADAIVRFLCYN